MIHPEPQLEIPAEVISNPALLFLYYRIEQILGIRAGSDALIKLNEFLEKRSGASFIENPAAYEHMLTSREEIFDLAKTLTVNETYFFREGAHFELLTGFLPQLAKSGRPIQICSAAASIGCEAYSIAMLLDFHSKNGPSFDFAIDAFDISAEAIETAKNARYTENTLRTDGAEWKYILDLYLTHENGEYVVSNDIRKKINFYAHNIMRGLKKRYDVVFFRNALIYFSSRNRLIVMNDIAESLFNDGLLFLGVSETSTVNHPLLAARYFSNVFYFQKIASAAYPEQPKPLFEEPQIPAAAKPSLTKPPLLKPVLSKPLMSKPVLSKQGLSKQVLSKAEEASVDCAKIAAILETEEGQPNAKRALEILKGEKKDQDGESSSSLSGSELAASVVFFLGVQDFDSADLVLSQLEKCNNEALTLYLRGEYHLLKGNTKTAENYYENAAGKEKAFWPAFYRIASLAADGNLTRYEYRIKKTYESIELGAMHRYECLLGGFSPDYFRRILDRKLQSLKAPERN